MIEVAPLGTGSEFRTKKPAKCLLEDGEPLPAAGESPEAWAYGGHPPTARMSSAAKLARLLEHTPFVGIDATTVYMLTGVRPSRHAKAFRDQRVAKAAEKRGWWRDQRMGPHGSRRSYITREPRQARAAEHNTP